ncbi:unnamed protein product [Trifolium pratense]|uniref:Uncharacterized protein n=1 Tax=Trifolium pratense TaxID=57577 RepID=A0ACB0IT52_TRIPR|nr:unnamed protein product [Trifolium pratense]
MKALSGLKDGFQFRLGDGKSSFWYTDWSGIGILANHVLYVDIHDIEIRVRDVFIDGNWNFNLLYTTMPNEVKEHLSNLPMILNSNVADCHTWKGNLNGLYTARDGYHWLNRNDFSDNSTTTVTWSWLWHIPAPEKIKFFLWTAIHKALPTKEMLSHRDGSSIDNPGASGFGGLIRNSDGAWVHGFSGNIGFSNILHAELMALYHGLLLAWELNIKDLRCYSDSATAIKLITEPVDK